jgi:hypothetical protein
MLASGLALLVVTAAARNAFSVSSDPWAFAQQYPVIIGAGIVLAVAGYLALFVGLLIWLIWLGRWLPAWLRHV